MGNHNEKYNNYVELNHDSKQSEIEFTIENSKSNLNGLQHEILLWKKHNKVEIVQEDPKTKNDIKKIIEETDFSNNVTWLYTPNIKESIINYIIQWELGSKQNMMLEFQLNKLAKNQRNRKLKYLLDHSQEPIAQVIKKINDKESVVNLFNKHSQYDHIINKYAKENSVDPLLIKSIIYQESKFDTNARSWSDAWGLMQLTPITIKEIERTSKIKIKNVYNPEENIRWGVKYISQLIKEFSWDIRIALAAYNAGPWNVKKHWNKIPPFKQTINYVKNIMRMYNIIKS